MASDDTMTVLSSMQDEEFDETDDGYEDHQLQPHNLSRLSLCTSSMYENEDEDDDGDGDGIKMFMSRLSIESFDGDDADEELSDEKEFKGLPELSSDSDKEPGFHSLPATPSRRRTHRESTSYQLMGFNKDYASENEVEKGMLRRRRRNLRKSNNKCALKKDNSSNEMGFSWESDQSGGGGGCGSSGLVVITRPKGGKRSLCMGFEEVKACRDLGFELEHERMLEIPCRVSFSGSAHETSSGGNSPIANWRISSPGDDPRDVKARLKVWAQAVALASTSR